MRTSWAQGHPNTARRDGYEVIRKGGRYAVFPRSAAVRDPRPHGPRDGLVEIWNGMPFFSPLWAPGPKVVVLHHVHAEMWRMVLPPTPGGHGRHPRAAHRAAGSTGAAGWSRLSESSKHEMVEIGFPPDHVEVVPPGIDPRFSPGGERTPTPTVVAVGRLVPVKRYDLLIRAVAEARRAGPRPHASRSSATAAAGRARGAGGRRSTRTTPSRSPAGCPTTSWSTCTGARGSSPAPRPARAGA